MTFSADKQSETAWLIAAGGSGTAVYWWGREAGRVSDWTVNPNRAIRFSRRQDAELAAEILGHSPPPRITEHMWLNRTSALPPTVAQELVSMTAARDYALKMMNEAIEENTKMRSELAEAKAQLADMTINPDYSAQRSASAAPRILDELEVISIARRINLPREMWGLPETRMLLARFANAAFAVTERGES